MKKIIIILLGLVAFLFIFFYYFIGKCDGKYIYVAHGYKLYTNLGKTVPGIMYVKYYVNTKPTLTEDSVGYVLVFDKRLVFDLRGGGYNPDVLVIYPNKKVINMTDLTASGFNKINDTCACQSLKQMDEVGIVNNTALYEHPPIQYAIFKKNKIIFNSYGPLKQFGDSIILELPLYPPIKI